MKEEKHFAIIQSPDLQWPSSLELPPRFRLFVAPDISAVSTRMASDFALGALGRGMVHFCAWGRDCERLHDIVDNVIAEDDASGRRFAGPTPKDTFITTWHQHDTLEQALDFFVTCAVPTDGFAPGSGFRLVICIGNPDWKATAGHFLESAKWFV
jgi:hypothetical protein